MNNNGLYTFRESSMSIMYINRDPANSQSFSIVYFNALLGHYLSKATIALVAGAYILSSAL